MSTSRRDFLKASLGASTLLACGATVPGFLCRAARAADARRNNDGSILVVVQLSGGNDGLNTVVPYTDDIYQRQRPTLRLSANQVHKIDAQLGWHPEMQAFARLFKEGHLGVIQGVGHPNSSRNHDSAKREWHTAVPKDLTSQTGWLGRAIDQTYGPGQADVPGIFVGPIKAPFGLQTERAVVPSIASLDQWALAARPEAAGHDAARDRLVQASQPAKPGADNPLLDMLQRTTVSACASNQRLEAALGTRALAGAAGYPQVPLAQSLRTIAQVIRADLGIRIYFTELGGGGIGGFDTHAGQAANHGVLLRELSESVAAFMTDLQRDKLLDRVLLMTFSDFGRALTENGRRGTGHGAAAPIFFAGGRVKGGLTGAHPSLRNLDDDAPRPHTDFRRVYATALDRWLGLDSQPILGGKFEPLEILAA